MNASARLVRAAGLRSALCVAACAALALAAPARALDAPAEHAGQDGAAGSIGQAQPAEGVGGDGLVLRAFDPPPPGRAVEAGPEGVFVRSSRGDVVVVGWDRVLRVPEHLASQAAQYAQLAEAAWRARIRVERGDLALAEPLLESLLEAARSGTVHLAGPTGMVVAEAMVRCRLARGATAQAVEPWLLWLETSIVRRPRTTYAYTDWSRRAGLAPVFDSATELCPAVPPMVLAGPSLEVVLSLDGLPLTRDKAQAMRAAYRLAAAWELGQPIEDQDRAAVDRTGGRSGDWASDLVGDTVASRVLGPSQRAQARARLVHALTRARAPWQAGWIRAALGRSLVLEADAESRLRGIAELLRVHVVDRAADARLEPLADACLVEAAAVLDAMGQGDAAGALLETLRRTRPQAQALRWPVLDRLGQQPAPWPPQSVEDVDQPQSQTQPEDPQGPDTTGQKADPDRPREPQTRHEPEPSTGPGSGGRS